MILKKEFIIGVIVFIVIETGIGYFLQKYLIVAKAYGSHIHFALIIVVIPFLIGFTLRILQTPRMEVAVSLGSTISGSMLYLYFQSAWKQPPTIFHLLSFVLTVGAVSYLGATVPSAVLRSFSTSNRPRVIPKKRNPIIFISYRRGPSNAMVGRIYDRLVGFFGRTTIFKDVDDIPPGADYREHLKKSLQRSEIMVVIIDQHWINTRNERGELRLWESGDYVRMEIEMALSLDLDIVPVLVENATMPKAEQLPQDISNIAFRQSVSIRDDPDFNTDVNKLNMALSGMPKNR